MTGRRYRDQVDVLTAPLVPGYSGQQVRDWDQAETATGIPASVQPLSSVEDTGQRQSVVSRWKALLPPAGQIIDSRRTVPALAETDRVRWRGRVFEVDGEVEAWTDLAARDHHQTLILRRASDGA